MKPIEDRGHLIEATRPWKPKTYRSDRRPDPVQCAGCLIVVCDPDDAASLHLEQSDGSRWRRLQFVDEPANVIAQPLPNIDIEAIAREVLARAVAQLPQPSVKFVPGPADAGDDRFKLLARGLAEALEHDQTLAQKLAELVAWVEGSLGDLAARVDYIERHALAAARLKEPA